MRVLIVDDQEVMRRVVVKTLEAHDGYICREAEDGKQALSILEFEHFDLVLMDMRMPVMSGIEALQELRGRAKTEDIPVIMVSSIHDKDSVVRALEAGADGFLVKPVKAETLLAKIEEVLSKGSRDTSDE